MQQKTVWCGHSRQYATMKQGEADFFKTFDKPGSKASEENAWWKQQVI